MAMDTSSQPGSSFSNRLFLHNLSYDVQQQDLVNFFIEQGVSPDPKITLMMNPRNKKPAGCAIVQLNTSEEIEKASAYD